MEVTAHVRDGAVLMAPRGRIDHASAEDFALALKPYLEDCRATAAPCVLDMAEVDYISSVGLRVLMLASKQVKAQAGR